MIHRNENCTVCGCFILFFNNPYIKGVVCLGSHVFSQKEAQFTNMREFMTRSAIKKSLGTHNRYCKMYQFSL